MRLGALALLELSAKLVYLVLLLLDHLPVVVDQLPIRPVVDGDLGVAASGAAGPGDLADVARAMEDETPGSLPCGCAVGAAASHGTRGRRGCGHRAAFAGGRSFVSDPGEELVDDVGCLTSSLL